VQDSDLSLLVHAVLAWKKQVCVFTLDDYLVQNYAKVLKLPVVLGDVVAVMTCLVAGLGCIVIYSSV